MFDGKYSIIQDYAMSNMEKEDAYKLLHFNNHNQGQYAKTVNALDVSNALFLQYFTQANQQTVYI